MTDAATYTVAEVSGLMRVGPDTVRAWVASGKLLCCPRLSPRSHCRIPASEVERLSEGHGMSARYDSERGKWVADFWYHHADGRRERFRLDAPVNSRRGALAYEQEVRKSIAAGTFRRNEPATLRAFARDFQAWCKNNLKPSTVEGYDKALRLHLVPFFGSLRLAEIGPADVERFRIERPSLSAKYTSNLLLCLSSLFRLAVEFGVISHAPKIRRPKLTRPQDLAFRFLDEPEACALLAAPSSYHPMILLALHTGMRLGELQALQWEDVDLRAKSLVCRRNFAGGAVGTPKGHKSRKIELTSVAVAVLGSVIRRLDTTRVFNTRTGRMVTKGDASKGLRKACVAAKIRPCGWHVLRHTFASWLVQRGVQLQSVQALLGHASSAVTERYAHLAPESGRQAVSVLEAR